jgi:peptidoglycan hydrolase CwlO-like protein
VNNNTNGTKDRTIQDAERNASAISGDVSALIDIINELDDRITEQAKEIAELTEQLKDSK